MDEYNKSDEAACEKDGVEYDEDWWASLNETIDMNDEIRPAIVRCLHATESDHRLYTQEIKYLSLNANL